MHTPIDLNSEIRIKSLVSSVEKEGVIESYILTLVYDEDSNNQAFSGYIFKHDNKGAFIEVYQYKQGTYIQTLKEINTSKNFSNRGCSCSTSVLEVVQLLQAGWDVGGLLDCVCVGGTTGESSSTFQEWSTPGSKLKDPIGWNLGHNNTLGGSGGSTTGNTSNSNNNISNELEAQDIKPWWNEDDKIINNLTDKAKCVYKKLLSSGISNFHNMITDLFIEFGNNNIGGRDLTFEMSTKLPDNIYGHTKVDLETGNYVIQINSNVMRKLSSIEVAAVLVHEMAHAFLGKHYRDSNSSFNELYKKYINDTGIQNYSHDIMKDQFINRMAMVLKNYHPNIFSSFDDYKILSSRGVFNLSDNQKNHLINVINNARQNDKICP